MDAVHSDEAVLFGLSQGVATSLMFATTFAEQVSGLILCGGLARSVEAPDYPWAPPLEDLLAANAEFIGPNWGVHRHRRLHATGDAAPRSAVARPARRA